MESRSDGEGPGVAARNQVVASALAEIGTPIRRPAGAVLFRQGEQPTKLFILLRGAVRLLLADDNAVIYRMAGPGDIVGLPAVCSGYPYSLTAEVVEDSELLAIERDRLMDLLRLHNDVSLQLVAVLAEEVHRVRDQQRGTAERSLSQRLEHSMKLPL